MCFEKEGEFVMSKFYVHICKTAGANLSWEWMWTSASRLQVLPGELDEQVLEGAQHLHGGHPLPVLEVLVRPRWLATAASIERLHANDMGHF